VSARRHPQEDALPRVAIVHGPTSAAGLDIQHWIGDVCTPIWVLDSLDPAIGSPPRLLQRFGPVIDIANMSMNQAADALRPHCPDGILAFADRQLMTAARLAQELSLVFHVPEVAERMLDKLVQRAALRDGGLPVPDWWPLPADAQGDEVDRVLSEAQFPVVVKPQRGTASSFTYLAEDARTLQSILADPENGTQDADFIVEEFLPGTVREIGSDIADFVSVESAVSDGNISHLAICGKFTLDPPFRGTGGFLPVELPADEISGILDMATRALRALDTTTGCTHTEIKLTPYGARIVEVNGRIGGNIPTFIQGAAGVSLPHIAVDLALDRPLRRQGLLPCHRVTFRVHGQPPTWATRFVDIQGLAAAAELPGVDEVVLRQPVDTAVNWRIGADRLIFVATGSAEDHQEMLAIRSRILSTITTTFE